VVYVVHWKTVAMDLLGSQKAGVHGMRALGTRAADQLLFYWKALPELLTWPVLAMSLLGLAISRWWSRRAATFFMLAWIAGVYVTFALISHKESRYVFYWLPPFAYFATGPFFANWRWQWLRKVGAACAILVLGVSLYSAWNYERPFVSGYSSVARDIVRRSRSGIILFDGDLPANFIFFLHSLDAERRFLVLRKALWVERIKLEGGSEELAHGLNEVRDVVTRNGVKYVVVVDSSNLHFAVQRSLRELLDSDPQFKLLSIFPIETNEPEWKNRRLLLYQNTRNRPPTDAFLAIRMLTLSHDIVVPWSELKRTW